MLRDSPTSQDVQLTLEGARRALREVPDDGWSIPADGLEWTCLETMMHILDDLGSYAMLLSGVHGHEGYTPLREFGLEPGRPVGLFWPEKDGGTRTVLHCLDAVGGLLVAVVASVPSDRVGWHPYGNPDRSGLAAMGIVELTLHTRDILAAHGVDYRAPSTVIDRSMDRIFATAARSGDPWNDLLRATGRTKETRGTKWRWDSSVIR